MGRKVRLNTIETGTEDYTGKKKEKKWKRVPRDGRYSEVEGLLAIEDIRKAPSARALHIVDRLPSQDETNKPVKRETFMYRSGPTSDTAERKPSAVNIEETTKSETQEIAPVQETNEPRREIIKEIDSLVSGRIRIEQDKAKRRLKRIEKLMIDIRRGEKKLVASGEWYDENEKVKIVEVIGQVQKEINTDDSEYKKSFDELLNLQFPVKDLRGHIRDRYAYSNLSKGELETEITSDVANQFSAWMNNPIMSEMIHLAQDIERGKIRVEDVKPGEVSASQKEEMSQISKEIPGVFEEERKILLVNEALSEQMNLMIKKERGQESSAFNAVKRALDTREVELPDNEIREIVAAFSQNSEQILREASVSVESKLRESNLPFLKEKIETPAFIVLRDKLLAHLDKYLAERIPNEPVAEESEMEFSPEQLEKMDKIADALRDNYLREIEDSRHWSPGWKGKEGEEKVKGVIQNMKWASAREAYDILVLNFKFPLMYKEAAIRYMLEKIFKE